MPKPKSSYPPIPALRALIKAYSLYHKIDPTDMSETKYLELLSERLGLDGIVSNASKNLLQKIIGNPGASKPELTDAIDLKILNALAQAVIDRLVIANELKSQQGNIAPWSFFTEYLFPTPASLEEVEEFAFYKFLPNQQLKDAVDTYVTNRLSEFIADKDIKYYVAYIWTKADRDVRTAILQINQVKLEAFFTLYSNLGSQIGPTLTLKSKSVVLDANSLTIHLAPQNSHVNFNVCFVVPLPGPDAFDLPYLKGLSIYGPLGASKPAAVEVILERHTTFASAKNSLNQKTEIADAEEKKKQVKKASAIHFELMERRIEISVPSLREVDQFQSNKNFQIASFAKGLYYVGFIGVANQFQNENKLVLGYCRIYANGKVDMEFEHIGTIPSYIENDIYHGYDCLTIKNFVKDGQDNFKFRYEVTVLRNEKMAVDVLKGTFSGWFTNLPLCGKISMLRIAEDPTETPNKDVYGFRTFDLTQDNIVLTELAEKIIKYLDDPRKKA